MTAASPFNRGEVLYDCAYASFEEFRAHCADKQAAYAAYRRAWWEANVREIVPPHLAKPGRPR